MDHEIRADSGANQRFDSVDIALAALSRGGQVVVVDDESRENEGDLIMAAEFATAATMGFMVRHTSGFVCVAMPAATADTLALPPMIPSGRNADPLRTAYAVTVDARDGVTTGISAADRAHTARVLAGPDSVPDDLTRPGHVVPLRARDNGVLERAGHTEATVDLCRLAGLRPVGVLCEIVNDDGSMARREQLLAFAKTHQLPIITVAQIVDYRRRAQRTTRIATCQLPTRHGQFTLHAYQSAGEAEHLVLVMGDPRSDPAPLVRVHSECLTGDVLGSRRCDCGTQLQDSMRAVGEAGRGLIIYHRGHEGRGIGLGAKIAAYALQDQGMDTVDANIALGLPPDARDYHDAVSILMDLGVHRVRLITNNPEKCMALASAGIEVVERIPLPPAVTADNLAYLRTKNERMGHRISGIDHPAGLWAVSSRP